MATRAADLATAPDRVLLDTSVLLAATDEGRAEHHDALTVLNDWAAGHTDLCTSGQILREYLTVATRPAEMNGLGLNLPDALGNVRAIRQTRASSATTETANTAATANATIARYFTASSRVRPAAPRAGSAACRSPPPRPPNHPR